MPEEWGTSKRRWVSKRSDEITSSRGKTLDEYSSESICATGWWWFSSSWPLIRLNNLRRERETRTIAWQSVYACGKLIPEDLEQIDLADRSDGTELYGVSRHNSHQSMKNAMSILLIDHTRMNDVRQLSNMTFCYWQSHSITHVWLLRGTHLMTKQCESLDCHRQWQVDFCCRRSCILSQVYDQSSSFTSESCTVVLFRYFGVTSLIIGYIYPRDKDIALTIKRVYGQFVFVIGIVGIRLRVSDVASTVGSIFTEQPYTLLIRISLAIDKGWSFSRDDRISFTARHIVYIYIYVERIVHQYWEEALPRPYCVLFSTWNENLYITVDPSTFSWQWCSFKIFLQLSTGDLSIDADLVTEFSSKTVYRRNRNPMSKLYQRRATPTLRLVHHDLQWLVQCRWVDLWILSDRQNIPVWSILSDWTTFTGRRETLVHGHRWWWWWWW